MPEQIFKRELQSLIVDLIKKYDQLGMRASGNWPRSLGRIVRSSQSRLTGVITGAKYTEQLVYGRRPGRFPPIQAIEKWIEEKNIQADIPAKSLAYLIARKIAREGTDYFKQGGTSLVDAVITDARVEDIFKLVGQNIVDDIVTEYRINLKRS